MKKKRTFLLLEVLIALSLISLSMVHLMLRPIHLHRGAVKQLERIEADRIAAWTFSEIKEKFLKNEVRWSQIPDFHTYSPWISLPDTSLQIPQLSAHSASRKYRFHTTKEKTENSGQISRLVSITIEVDHHQFTYPITLTKSVSSS